MSSFFEPPHNNPREGFEASRSPPGHGEFDDTEWKLPSGYILSNPPSESSSFSGSDPRPPSLLADFHHAIPGMTAEVRLAMMANFLHGKQEEKLWTTGAQGEGVFLRRNRGSYITCPATLSHDGSLTFTAVYNLNVPAAMTVKTKVIELLLGGSEVPFIQINESIRLQVIPDIEALPYCKKHQCAAFVMSERMLVLWDDEPHSLIKRAEIIDDALFKMVCREASSSGSVDGEEFSYTLNPWKNVHEQPKDDEKRPVVVYQSFFTAATLILAIGVMGLGWRHIAIETTVDGSYMRLLFILCILPQFWLGLFFFQSVIGNAAQIFGWVEPMRQNTHMYSGKAPTRLDSINLPHVTIQMPVFKEDLEKVITPTIKSLKKAISTYEMQGGSANIFINDDGMQVIPEEDARERQKFYDSNNIGWVARPPHNPKGKIPDKPLHIRPGKFKKASNMNYALRISMVLERALNQEHYQDLRDNEDWDQQHENEIYANELRKLIDRNGAWADGNLRVGDYILIVDSDTRVPEDCLLEAVSEMEQCRNVAILQFASGVVNVTGNFFEMGITFFTNLVYTQIKFAVSNGDVAPFVGHNAFLRWASVQEVAFTVDEERFVQDIDVHGFPIYEDILDEETGELAIDEVTGMPRRDPVGTVQKVQVEKYWSESTVSEDFDMALRLQSAGYIVRLAAYQGTKFQEGVSLTVYDELHRWEKYAYGCNELIFHPIWYWHRRGPITSLFARFLSSGIPLSSKLTICAYIGTYYAIGSAWILTLANYFLVGWFEGLLDHYYIDSFKVYFSIICVFTGLGNLALAVLRYRLGEGSLLHNLWVNIKWVPLLVLFLGGISFHVSQALAWHMLGVDMDWGATAKDMVLLPFFEEIPQVLRRFRWSFVFCIVTVAGMITCAYGVPYIWQIRSFTPIYPLSCVVISHFLLPIVLNPNLMRFTW